MPRITIKRTTYDRLKGASTAPGGFNPGLAVFNNNGIVEVTVSEDALFRLKNAGLPANPDDIDATIVALLDATKEGTF